MKRLLILALIGLANSILAAPEQKEASVLQDLPNHYRVLAQEIAHQLGEPTFRNLVLKKFSQQQLQIASASGEQKIPQLSIPLTSLLKEYRKELATVSPSSSDAHALTETTALAAYATDIDQDVLEAKGIQGLTSELLELNLIVPKSNKKDPSVASVDALLATADAWQELLVAYPPSGSDVEKCLPTKENPSPKKCKKGDVNYRPGWAAIEAFDQNGHSHQLDAKAQPDFPVLSVDLNERKDMVAGLTLLDKTLVENGYQARVVKPEVGTQAVGNIQFPRCLKVHRLTEIRFENVEEPWIKGDAEVYAIVNGLCTDGKRVTYQCDKRIEDRMKWVRPDVEPNPPGDEALPPNMIPLEFVKRAGVTYDAGGEPIIFWDKYDFEEVSIVFMEHDTGANFKEIALALTKGVEESFLFRAVPSWMDPSGISAAVRIADKVLSAMPSSWFTDDDDHLDTRPVIRIDKPYHQVHGRNKNAKFSLWDSAIKPKTIQWCKY